MNSVDTVLQATVKSSDRAWHTSLRRFFLVTAFGHLVWEFAHMPLYTLWETGTRNQIVFAAVHCTGGDLLIASATLMVALLLFGNNQWPSETFGAVTLSMIILGIGYTVFSEWLNIVIRQSWAYSEAMPIVPVLDVGLSPLLQWIVVPSAPIWWARRAVVVH